MKKPVNKKQSSLMASASSSCLEFLSWLPSVTDCDHATCDMPAT